MIIKQLILDNFRVFSGRHSIDLKTSIDSPIILFGGLNGAGKTSILTAVRFALLGKMAFENITSQKDYITQIAKLIHKSSVSDSNLKASINLTFEYIRDGKPTEYSVQRTWEYGSLDTLIIRENNVICQELNYEQAQAFLFELVPSGVANLVFFDGEKIAELAEDNKGIVLKDAVNKLLGLNTVQRLQEDLRIYLKKAGISSANYQIQKEFENIESEKSFYFYEGQKFRTQADNHFNVITELNQSIKLAEQKLLTGGGAWANDRENAKKEVDGLLAHKQSIETDIQKEFDGCYPLSLAPDILKKLSNHLNLETDYRSRENFSTQFEVFLPAFSSALLSSEANSSDILDLLRAKVNEYATEVTKPDIELGISEQQIGLLSTQIDEMSAASSKNIVKLKKKLIEVESIIENAAINIERAPEKEQLQANFNSLRALEQKKKEAVKQYSNELLKAKEMFVKAQQATQRLLKLHGDMKKSFGDNESAVRAASIIELLAKFSTQLSDTRLRQIELEFNQSYKNLARKEDLQIFASIDRLTYGVTLRDNTGNVIDRKAISAGEKQIYAIAMLDALGKVSGKRLPIVIDTPLGRLDSNHRGKLIEHYFPKAGDQVIILSTDTEIDEGYFDSLKNNISQCYQITFDSKSQSSFVDKGYFWKHTNLQEVI